MNKTLLATLLLSAIFSSTSFAAEQSTTETETYSPSEPLVLTPVVTEENDASLVEEAPKFDDTMHYFVGVTGGMADMSFSLVHATSAKDKVSPSSPDASGFAGADIGFYTAGGKGRIYYSYQKMSGESEFDNKKIADTDVTLHLLSADYFFRADKAINPFVGAHVGYMTAETTSEKYGSYKQSNPVLGIQAGVAWRISDHFTTEVGARHTASQRKEQTDWAGSEGKDMVYPNTQSDLKSITTFYMSANYRF
ncbi:outer membrane beta-barrel protein [Photobacterium leiognathi]|uniref:outer membrane beta-barrel protein n=1 Tax=Photobacterium leiognathi TaxID=553611 RepID=UPI0027357332|nr:outer membrane beta-barrel protein [Photobacterium leiognathi]